MKAHRSTKYRVKLNDGRTLMRTAYELEFERVSDGDELHVRVMRGEDLVATLEARMTMTEVMTMIRDMANGH